jgi:ubiquinone/menaquinone biosynthesis C-methylase UbiE
MQYATDENLRIRQQTHANYTVGQPREPWLDALLALEPDAALLDVGTANGAFPIRLRQAGHRGRLVGVDLSHGMIELAQAQAKTIEFLQANAIALPFPDSSFDVVTARHMLYHVPDIQKALLEFRRVLKSNGTLFALTNADGYLADYWAVILETLNKMHELSAFLSEITSPKFFHNDLWQHIKSVFGETELCLKTQHLEFTNAAQPLAYWNSIQAGSNIEPAVWQTASQKLEQAFATKTQTPWCIQKSIALLKTHNS